MALLVNAGMPSHRLAWKQIGMAMEAGTQPLAPSPPSYLVSIIVLEYENHPYLQSNLP